MYHFEIFNHDFRIEFHIRIILNQDMHQIMHFFISLMHISHFQMFKMPSDWSIKINIYTVDYLIHDFSEITDIGILRNLEQVDLVRLGPVHTVLAFLGEFVFQIQIDSFCRVNALL